MLRYESERWLRCPTPTTATLKAVWVAPDGTVWVAGEDGTILSFDGRTWSPEYSERLGGSWKSLFQDRVPSGNRSSWFRIGGFDDDDIWFAGSAMAHFDGHSITVTDNLTYYPLLTVNGTRSNDVWAAGCNGTLIHWDGQQWSDFTITPWPSWDYCFRALWANSSNDILAVGSYGIARHWDGSTWASAKLLHVITTRALFGVGGSLYAAGDSTTLSVDDGCGWQDIASLSSIHDNAIWGSSTADLWIVGEGPSRAYAAHLVGGSLTQQSIDGSTALTGVSGRSASQIYATGNGKVYRYDGKAWSDQKSGIHLGTTDIWVSPSGVQWVVGESGILRHDP